MKNDLENMIEECNKRSRQGASPGDLVSYLHQERLTIVDSMKVLKEIYKLSLGEAKEIVTSHPVWAEQVRDADILHEELEKALRVEDVDSTA